jgi:hypothetical protein
MGDSRERNIGRIVMGLLDNSLEVDAIIGDIVFFFWDCWSHFKFSERESACLWPLLMKKRELGGTRLMNKACILHKRLLGTSGVMSVQSKLRCSKFNQMEEWCLQYEQVLVI